MARKYILGPREGYPSPRQTHSMGQEIPVLTDESPMPWGKHKDTPMKKVSARYLLYIWDVDDGLWLDGPHLRPSQKSVRNYIVDSFKALEIDAPDHNVAHHPDKVTISIRALPPPQFK